MAVVDPSPTGKALAEDIGRRVVPELRRSDRDRAAGRASSSQRRTSSTSRTAWKASPPASRLWWRSRSPTTSPPRRSLSRRPRRPACRSCRPPSSPQSADPEGEGDDRVRVGWAGSWRFTASVGSIKPDDYFDIAWRREKGAGPVFLNLIHDVDNLRYLCGEVVSVQAIESNAVRGNAVEDTRGHSVALRERSCSAPSPSRTRSSRHGVGNSRQARTLPIRRLVRLAIRSGAPMRP